MIPGQSMTTNQWRQFAHPVSELDDIDIDIHTKAPSQLQVTLAEINSEFLPEHLKAQSCVNHNDVCLLFLWQTTRRITSMNEFRLKVDDVYYIGGVGHVLVGTVVSGTLNLETLVELRVENALPKRWFAVPSEHNNGFMQHNWKNIFTQGEECGVTVTMKKLYIIAGDVVNNAH